MSEKFTIRPEVVKALKEWWSTYQGRQEFIETIWPRSADEDDEEDLPDARQHRYAAADNRH